MNEWSQALSGHRVAGDSATVQTISGNRGLQIEEKLLFEQDSPGHCGVDLPEPPAVRSRRRPRRWKPRRMRGRARPAGGCRARGWSPGGGAHHAARRRRTRRRRYRLGRARHGAGPGSDRGDGPPRRGLDPDPVCSAVSRRAESGPGAAPTRRQSVGSDVRAAPSRRPAPGRRNPPWRKCCRRASSAGCSGPPIGRTGSPPGRRAS